MLNIKNLDTVKYVYFGYLMDNCSRKNDFYRNMLIDNLNNLDSSIRSHKLIKFLETQSVIKFAYDNTPYLDTKATKCYNSFKNHGAEFYKEMNINLKKF